MAERYTLAEAALVLARSECARDGHDLATPVRTLGGRVPVVVCERCRSRWYDATEVTGRQAAAWHEAAGLAAIERERERRRLGPGCDVPGLLGNYIGGFREAEKVIRARADVLAAAPAPLPAAEIECPGGLGPCTLELEWGHPCDRDENGDRGESCERTAAARRAVVTALREAAQGYREHVHDETRPGSLDRRIGDDACAFLERRADLLNQP